MCEDVSIMEGHVQGIFVHFEGLGKGFDEQDDAADKIEKEIAGRKTSKNRRSNSCLLP